ncbi:response regulator [Terrimonas sp. NA20]|uniref:histidine kinase n=1 Tax=Terrimonas ginsenosidimutans TaxID=2908004 RepID=A0ABS9KM03_9BACT|nr:two-component regulator propeller domain-containing protein [Terrimonas ginsenosidimutans]MCG2613360.1 response regulator [Terrimonas ginsenosidimutans]
MFAKRHIFLVSLFIILSNGLIQGQQKYSVQYYSTEHGLSHQAVTCMLKDKDGFMWFGTWDGIDRFDGQKFLPFKSSPADRLPLGNGRIDQIIEDQSGHIWLLAYDRQIYEFDKRNRKFARLSTPVPGVQAGKIGFKKIHAAANGWVWVESDEHGLFCVPQNNMDGVSYRYYNKAKNGFRLPGDSIRFFHTDKKNRIWIGGNSGLACLSPDSSGEYRTDGRVPASFEGATDFVAVQEDEYCLYFAAKDGRLITYTKATKTFTTRRLVDGQITALLRSKNAEVIYAAISDGRLVCMDIASQSPLVIASSMPKFSHSLYEDSNGCLWIEPEESGAIRFNPHNKQFVFFPAKERTVTKYIGNRYRILEDNSGTIWVNLKGGGFGYYNTQNGTIENRVSTVDTSMYRLPPFVLNTYLDNSGVLWMTTYERELIKIVSHGNDFVQRGLVAQKASRWDNEVRGIYFDNKGRLWTGVKHGSVCVYSGDRLLTDIFVNPPPKEMSGVYSILQDSRGNIWLGTKGAGLFMASPVDSGHTKYLLQEVSPERNNQSVFCKEIYSLIEDRSGRIWIGSFDEGLFLATYTASGLKFTPAGKLIRSFPKDGFQKIRHLATDHDGNLWAGTTSGLVVINITGNDIASYPSWTYKSETTLPNSLGNNDIQFILHDSQNRMWLGTSGGGLYNASGADPLKSLSFRGYTRQEGMPNDYVLSFAEDVQGNLWLATANGIARFNPANGSFRNYNSNDGLSRVSFSEASVCQKPDGQLIFGNTRGLLSFYPGKMDSKLMRGEIALTNLQVNNKDIKPGIAGGVLEKDINFIEKLTLSYDQNILSFDFAFLDYRAGNHQSLDYRLMGFDSTWYKDKQLRRATYTNLSPGEYKFQLRVQDADGYTDPPFRSLTITILPPPWKTWWAYLLYAVVLCALFFIIRKYALTLIRLRHKIVVERKLAALKLNFFTSLSHELRTPLTLIVNPLEQLARKEKLSPEGVEYVDVARKNADRMVRFINQLLDLRKTQSNSAVLNLSRIGIVSFAERICDHFTGAAKAKGIAVTIEADEEVQVWGDAEKLEVVIYNLLANALKFTPEGRTIQLFIKSEEETFSVGVSDEGPGVPADKLEKIFELFYEEPHNSSDLKGTGIGLALCREFVELHGGKIWAENNSTGGLTVWFRLTKRIQQEQAETNTVYPDTTYIQPVITSAGQSVTPESAFGRATPASDAPLVLLVEDNNDLRSFISAQLKERYRVETAQNGREGLEKIKVLMPDLVVSDIMMPEMDGIRMLDKIKNDITVSHIPVVLLSAKSSIESQVEGLRFGADFYITKPFNTEMLFTAIDNLITRRKRLFESLVKNHGTISVEPKPLLMTPKDEVFLKTVIQLVEERMVEPDFNIELVAEGMSMSRTTFYKKFKSLTAMTPVEFVRDFRLEKAKQYLEAGDNNVSEVAYMTGFSNPNYFSTCFKEKYGRSPSEFIRPKSS